MKHTQGKAEITANTTHQNAVTVNGKAVCFVPRLSADSVANASLIVEAFNVANDTGLSPAELAARLKEVKEQNREMIEALKFFAMLNPLHYKDIAGGILKTVELLTKTERIRQ